MPLFRKLHVCYLEASLLEVVWKVLKLADLRALERVRAGVEAVRRTYSLVNPPADAYIEAVRIYRLEHMDCIDAIHYSTAIRR